MNCLFFLLVCLFFSINFSFRIYLFETNKWAFKHIFIFHQLIACWNIMSKAVLTQFMILMKLFYTLYCSFTQWTSWKRIFSDSIFLLFLYKFFTFLLNIIKSEDVDNVFYFNKIMTIFFRASQYKWLLISIFYFYLLFILSYYNNLFGLAHIWKYIFFCFAFDICL